MTEWTTLKPPEPRDYPNTPTFKIGFFGCVFVSYNSAAGALLNTKHGQRIKIEISAEKKQIRITNDGKGGDFEVTKGARGYAAGRIRLGLLGLKWKGKRQKALHCSYSMPSLSPPTVVIELPSWTHVKTAE